jgi:hydrogenase nickel incorporation protein HypA/HybF
LLMHEVSVAQALLEAVIEGVAADAAAAHVDPGIVQEIHLRVGPMAGIAVPALAFAFEVAARNTIAEGAELIVQRDPVVVWCSSCGTTTEYETLAFDCGECGALSADVTADNGLELVRLVTAGPCA